MLTAEPTATPSCARARNAELNAEEYRLRKTHLTSRPTMVYVELTQNCNLSCRMCRSANSFDKAKNMPDLLFEKVLRDLAPTASWMDLRGWGESTILPDFTDKLRRTVDTGVRVLLVTNGLLITEEQFHLICASNGTVSVSVDAATPALYEQLGRGDCNRVMRNVAIGTAICRLACRGDIYFHTVVSNYNLHELESIVALADSVGVRRVVLSPIKTWTGHDAGLDNVPVEVTKAVRKAIDRARQLGMVLQLSTALHPSLVVPDALPTACASPWSHALIDYQGELIFCDHLLNRAEYSMGSLSTASFERVWNGDVFQSLRQAHVTAEQSRTVGARYGKCNWCYSNRYKDSESAPISTESLREVSTRMSGTRGL